MTAVFGNVRFDRRQFRDLMASPVGDRVSRVQAALALPTGIGDQVNGRVHTLGGNQQPRVARMAWLPARLASTLAAAAPFALPASEAIGRRRLRRRRRVLLSECELTLQFRDPSGLFPDLPFSLGKLLTQSLNLTLQTLVGIIALLFVRPRHDSHGTPIGSRCTAT
jgi:hypothetical protein